jgi:hypothetical protein
VLAVPIVLQVPGLRVLAIGWPALEVAIVQHRPGRAEDCRQAHADRAHHRARCGLVAAGEQHDPVDRQRAQQLLDFHRQEVAVEHGGRLDHHFAQTHRRQLEGEAAGHQDAALDRFGALAQVGVTGRQIAPGVDDRDARLLQHVLTAQAHLLGALAVREGAHVARGKPAPAAQIGERLLAVHRQGRDWENRICWCYR